jgi:outer membrane protein assembly factor BamB
MKTRCLLLGAMLGLTSLSAGADNDWPQYRGPGRDNKVTGFTAPATWPKELSKKWNVSVGDGVASPALVGDKVYVFTRDGGDEVITCLNAETGKEVWKEKYACDEVKGVAAGFKGQQKYTGPRSSPAVGEGKVCTFSVVGRLSCFDAATGKPAWNKETKGRPMFYTSTSPLIADGKCIIHVGAGGGKGGAGKGDLIAFDLTNGEEKWKWSGDGPGYASPVVATIRGVKQIVHLTDSNLIGVGFDDGKLLWKTALTTPSYQSATPVIDGDVVICGGTAFTIEKSGDAFEAKRLWKDKAPYYMNTPVLKDSVLYGLTAVGKAKTTNLYAQEARTGKVLWEDSAQRGECGEILDVGGVLLLLSSDSNLVVFKPDKSEFKEVAKYKVADTPTFAMPIVAGKRIYVKDRDSLILWTIE